MVVEILDTLQGWSVSSKKGRGKGVLKEERLLEFIQFVTEAVGYLSK